MCTLFLHWTLLRFTWYYLDPPPGTSWKILIARPDKAPPPLYHPKHPKKQEKMKEKMKIGPQASKRLSENLLACCSLISTLLSSHPSYTPCRRCFVVFLGGSPVVLGLVSTSGQCPLLPSFKSIVLWFTPPREWPPEMRS